MAKRMSGDEWEEKRKEKKANEPKLSFSERMKAAKAAKAAKTQEPITSPVTTELVAANDLLLPENMSEVAWDLPDGMSYEDWQRAGMNLKRAEAGVQFWYGDWWIWGREQKWWAYGDGKEVAKMLDLNYQTLMDYAAVCRKFPKERRRAGLSFKHHRELQALSFEDQEARLDAALESGVSANKLRSDISKEKARAKTREVTLDAEALGKYSVLYADPPWRFESPRMGGSTRNVENHYPTMALEDIISLPVGSLATADSILYLWATAPCLDRAIEVMRAWGFVYKSNLVWVKDRIGMGYYFRNQHEQLLVGTRGTPGVPDACKSLSSVLEAPRLEHSAKPLETYEIIDRCWPGVRKLELFARPLAAGEAIRKGWSLWGNQIDGDDSLVAAE